MGTPYLDFELLEKIYNEVEIPLVLHGGSGSGASEPVAFPRTPFGIHQHSEPILEGHIPELRVFQLGRKLLCHDAHVDLSELTNRFVTEHYLFPLL